jgi:hypothetical protein
MRVAILGSRQLANPNTQQRLLVALAPYTHHSMSKHRYQEKTRPDRKHTSNPFIYFLSFDLLKPYHIPPTFWGDSGGFS